VTKRVTYKSFDAQLVKRGFPATSPWWFAQIRRFYASTCRQLVLRVGRRGGKSSTLARVAVVEALFGRHVIPPGDVGVVAIISVSRDEAAQRLRTVKAILDALNVEYKPIDHGIELLARPIVIKTFAASLAGVSGFTAICVICDEVAKWRDTETGVNPASEVLASLRPTMATQPNAKIFLSSSPLGVLDAHAKAFDLGENAFQLVAHAPTWEANPTISEATTHDLEPDARVWRREYAAIPQASLSAAFDADAVDAAMVLDVGGYRPSEPVCIIDASSGASDAFTWAIARWMLPPPGTEGASPWKTKRSWNGVSRSWDDEVITDDRGEPVPDPKFNPRHPGAKAVLRIEHIGAVEGGFWSPTAAGVIADKIVACAIKHGARTIYGDQRETLGLAQLFTDRGAKFVPVPWTNENKGAAVGKVRALMRERRLSLEHNVDLRRELLQFEEKITPSGVITFGARGKTHDDRVALLVTAAIVDALGRLPSSPLARRYTDFSALAAIGGMAPETPSQTAQREHVERVGHRVGLRRHGIDIPEPDSGRSTY